MSGKSTVLIALAWLTLGASACASGGTKKSNTSQDKITASEIAEANVTSVYDLVSRLRPNWLRPAGLTMTGNDVRYQTAAVYVDGLRYGGIDALRTLTTTGIRQLEYLSPTQAATVVRDANTNPATAVIMIYMNK